ncbi:Eco57I restriction-modification methylase domain-containing protein [Acinetobacter ursingii]|uniref:Eco57I restriction-modification methylase domain-containing protein n=1 Tax=Acinetobacter ursingii TaxID=108980 RepID=UPI0021CD8DC6|nr:N-6 DNA methylase [Acinetobacter ursingii]MCU4604840.1 Eco57I restriction-modification methylase domain-containing protein [Acinetobacter ursingii]MDH2019439.1 Eco57I restriction-modification methylase domain-containing protein [Acinetobacter ursingii]MDH2071823.1 Eco57I restriction-modification methylase domain-containing protein [Acinetobacter ursingii]
MVHDHKLELAKLIRNYETNRKECLNSRYNETLLRSDYLDPFFELLGWDIKNKAGKPTNEREVVLEEALKASASEHSKKPDYTFRLFSERKFFLEAKKPSVHIESDNETAKQVRRYGFTAKLKISVLSNFEYLVIYDTSVKVDGDDTFNKARIKKYHYTEYETHFDEICDLLGRESVYSGNFDKEWLSIENKINHFSVDTLFLKQINTWRLLLGEEIYKYQPTIQEDELNDIVQSYLNRIIFLRVCEDRNLETYQTLLNFASSNDFSALIDKFKQADRCYNSGLFDQLLTEQIIEDISSVFWVIIKQLYYPESPYSFSVFSSDILGNIYEIFLSEKLVINQSRVELVKKPENLDRDIVTTPTFIINDILRNTVLPKCYGKTDIEILQLKFADIACGSGAFLLELFQLLNDTLVDYYLSSDTSQLIPTGIGTYKLSYEIKRKVLLSCIFGIDKDLNAVEAAKFGLLLKLLEGEDVQSIANIRPVLPDLLDNILFGNSLLEPEKVELDHQVEVNPLDFSDLKFDVIVGNPPYMKSEDMKNITPLELPLYKKNYVSAYKQFDKYFLFLERGLALLKEEGILGYIVPSKFTKVGAGKKLRELLTDKGYLDSIVSFGANQIFQDKTTYTCLLILRKTPHTDFKYAEVRNLIDWKVRKADAMEFSSQQLGTLQSNAWILIPSELISVYHQILSQSQKLEDIVGIDNIFNGIQTSANDVYIFVPSHEDTENYYFIKKGQEYKIEKEITKPYFKTTSGEDNLYTYRTFKPNARVIYPYTQTENSVELIPLDEIQEIFPLAYKYLMSLKFILSSPKRDIKPIPKTTNEWYRYGRHQSLDNCGLRQKIIVGVLSVGDKYAIDTYGTLISSGGTAGYCVVALPDNCKYSIYYLQAILNSKYLEWLSALHGEVFRGGYIARGTKVLKNLPIRKIDFDNLEEANLHDLIANKQKELIEIYDKIDVNVNNKRVLTPLQRMFKREKEALDQLLNRLYNLGVDDSLIPYIKDLYEAH